MGERIVWKYVIVLVRWERKIKSWRACRNVAQRVGVEHPCGFEDGCFAIYFKSTDEAVEFLSEFGSRLPNAEAEVYVRKYVLEVPDEERIRVLVEFMTPTSLPSGFPTVQDFFSSIAAELGESGDFRNKAFVKYADLKASRDGFTGKVEYVIVDKSLMRYLAYAAVFGVGMSKNLCKGRIRVEVLD